MTKNQKVNIGQMMTNGQEMTNGIFPRCQRLF